jgi:nucleoside-diphosphate-sugar epimerase
VARTAFFLGGTGLIGRAAVPRLLGSGWEVVVGSRGRRPVPAELAGARTVELDRREDGAVANAVGDGVDLVVDVLPFTADDARQLLSLQGRVGSVIAISSASVYTDHEGRSLDESTGPDDFPDLPVPIPESQPTVAPGSEGYSSGKAAMERTLLDQDALPATVIRPCAIHGPGALWNREWFFVKRALDRRPYVLLAYGGDSRFHTTASVNLAELIRCVAERPGTRALNCAEPEAPSVLEIARVLARLAGHERSELLLPGAPPSETVGNTPWSTPKPFVVDMSAAEREVGYRPVVRYEEWVEPGYEWLLEATRDRDWHEVLPSTARLLGDGFDYEAEDAFVRDLTHA